MSKRKGLSLEEKRRRMLEMFYEKKEVYQLKEVEKIASKEKGITSMAVKDVLQSLVDDNMVDSDRIGTSNYFWAFPSKASQARKRTIEDLSTKCEESEKKRKMMQKAIEAATVGRETSDERTEVLGKLADMVAVNSKLQAVLNFYEEVDPEDERTEVLVKLAEMEAENSKLQTELNLYKEVDPEVLDQIKRETKIAHEAANRWTDNVFSIKSWCKKKFGMEEKRLDQQFGISQDFDYVE